MSIDPEHAGPLGLLFFYCSLFLALAGSFSVVGFLLHRKVWQDGEIIFRRVKQTFTRGVYSAFFVAALLWLQQQRWLRWWSGVLLFLLFLFLEGIFLTKEKRQA